MDYVVAVIVGAEERNYDERLRLRNIRDFSNPFEIPEVKFRKLFRVPKSGALSIIRTLDDPILNEGIPKQIKVLAVLQFLAQGSYQAAVGQDNLLGISQPTTVSRCLDVVTKNIVQKLTPLYIKFPTTQEEKNEAKAEFQALFGIPNTLGAVDGTHIAINKPLNHPTAPGNLFYNRKGFYSINCQIVCSAEGMIIGLNPSFPGSTHDASIWQASDIQKHLRNDYIRGINNQWLLGDKAYPLQPWLMTPLMEPETVAERAYNACHIKARNVVEMCNGRLKNKFRCLNRHRCLHNDPAKAALIVLSACTIYNMFLNTFDADEDLSSDDGTDDDSPPDSEDVQAAVNRNFLNEACLIRQNLINSSFLYYLFKF